MPDGIPDGITRDDLEQAIADFDAGVEHPFAESTGYDLVFGDRRYPPKAIVGLAARRLAGRTLTPYDFKGGEASRCFRILKVNGFDVVPKPGLDQPRIPFVVSKQYTRNDIYQILTVPIEQQRGDWDTGYHRHDKDWFIFASVGSAGRTGHDYDNYWDGEAFVWHGKTRSRIEHPTVQSLLNPPGRVFVFTRERDRDPFTFEGCGNPASSEPTTPVTIRWQFPDRPVSRLPEELPPGTTYREGTVRTILINAYERNPQARRVCIAHYGTACVVCDFDFGTVYGETGEGFIHVHHLKEISSIGEEYVVDPIADLRPVCPNCHAMLHTTIPAMPIEALKNLMDCHRHALVAVSSSNSPQ